ncbi:S-layer homology domain-containing protein [Paenibacillus alkalitolerans]|uniref:S-layer homology domain-containing protein n=1 Tax=Paenibacillus alkalitolerans TaxID=2799335 RepID=UPI0018F63D15|nr:S-layer homology domain-containing protein [Paenibacillus alkalitolerans]
MAVTIAASTCTGAAVSAADFEDVPATSSYYPYINELKALGVIDGISEGKFGPEQTLTRAQFAKIVSIAFRLQNNGNIVPFSDIQNHWAEEYIHAAYQAGIITGTSERTFSPGKAINREEAAVMVWRYAQKQGLSSGKVLNFREAPASWAVTEISSVIAHGWYGKDVKKISDGWSYRPKDAMTREEAAALIDLSMQDVPGSLSNAGAGKPGQNGSSGVSSGLPSGNVPYGSMVVLTAAKDGAAIYYTIDGSDPKTSRTRKHYSSPIPVLNNVVIKTYAVNYSSSGKASSSDVSTYWYVTKAALSNQSGLNDPLDNFKQIHSRSNIFISSSDPAYFGNDSKRMARTSTKPGTIIYRTDYDISSIMIYSYFFTGIDLEKNQLFVSENGKDYKEITAKVYAIGYPAGNWQQYVYEVSSLPLRIRYLKIVMRGSAKSWSPQLSKVTLNRSTASVDMKSTRSADSLLVELTSDSKGARIYYRVNNGSAFKPYSGPLKLTGYNVLETYAVKDGKVPSPFRKYRLNAGKDVKVDRFGQMVSANFPGKVTSEEELVADAAADASYYGSLKPPADRDSYGGLAGSSAKYGIKGTGFFAIQKVGNRKMMTTPAGNIFFSIGMNGITPNETYTMVKGREHDFEWLPTYEGEYQSAFITPDHGSFSFYMANKFRKTGAVPTNSSFYAEAVYRLKKWGFNSAGGFSPDKYGQANKFPYTRMLPLNSMSWAKISGISIFDIFAPDAEAKIDQAFKQSLTPYKNDPLLIGYFIDNEYDFHKFYSHVPKLKASSAAIKGRLVQTLKNKYKEIDAYNSSWNTSFKSFDELKDAELPVSTSQSWRDMNEFFRYYLDTFYGTVSRIYRKYDPNHLLLGDRWMVTPFRNEKFRSVLAEVEGKYVDVISINYYSYNIETDLLNDVYTKSGGKPILISEFGYGTGEQGLKPLLPNSAGNQLQRGMRYRNYVEGVASLDYIVGAHLFNYVDQAGHGRYWQGIWGERYNSGVINVADRPYKDYLEGIRATNYDIYKVFLRERPKFYYDFSSK